MTYDEYVKVRESLSIRIIIWVDTILNHIDTRMILPRYEDSCMVYRPGYLNGIKQQKGPMHAHTLTVSKKKINPSYTIDTQMVFKRNNNNNNNTHSGLCHPLVYITQKLGVKY